MTETIRDASTWEVAGYEVVGRTEHPWLRNPQDQSLHLWKPAQEQRLARREHLAEKLASDLAALLGVPCAAVQLAQRKGVQGCLSESVQPREWQRRFGEDLLLDVDPTFRAATKRHAAYTVGNLRAVLPDVAAPGGEGTPAELPEQFDAFDVLAGYLVFDALILNRDRHAKNWAVLRPRRGGTARLCAMYDNASSFGLALSDGRAQRITGSAGVDDYVAGQCSARAFAQRQNRDSTLFEVAADALHQCSPAARLHWLQRLANLHEYEVIHLVTNIPGLSEPMRTFIPMMLRSTRDRICGA